MSTQRHIVLLRGINVGGKHRMPMADLRALLTDAGCRDVKTYIQSGNVALTPPDLPDLQAHLAGLITDRFGFSVPVVVRTLSQLRAVIAGNPYDEDPKLTAVAFLADRPDPAAVASLDPKRSPGDRYTVVGDHIYLRFAKGVAGSKLTNAWFDRQLGTTSTARNWRTVGKLLELAAL